MATLQEMLEKTNGDVDRAEEIARFLVADDPKYLLDLELILSVQGKLDEAWEVSNKVTKLFPQDNRAAFNRGWLIVQRGDLLEGFRQIERGRIEGIYGKPYISTHQPVWDGKEDITGKTVLFHCECGLGDEIINIRFVKILLEKGAKVVVGCSPELITVFNRIKGVAAVVNREASTAVYHDYWVPSMSSIKICGVTFDTLSSDPYLSVDPLYVKKWKNIIKENDNLKVGIRWAGNVCYEEELWRTIPVDELIQAVDIPGVELYSLQRDDNTVDLPEHITDLGPFLTTWEDTGAAIVLLDLVISSCTSVPHFSAAMGQKTWVIVPTLRYYTWASLGEKTPWYTSARLFNQKKFRDWSSPLEEVNKELLKEVQKYAA